MLKVTGSVLLFLFLSACSPSDQAVDRWYSTEQVAVGQKVFSQHCAACHGNLAQGLVTDWKTSLSDGSLPPPPLNGSAHTWHHDMSLLLQTIQKGGVLYDGKMPGFSGTLSESEQYAVIAWFQSLWSDEIYLLWQEGNDSSKPFAIQPSEMNSGG